MPKKTSLQRVFAEVKALLSAYDSNIRAIALQVCTLVLEMAPDVVKQIVGPVKMLAYGFTPTY